MKLENFESGSDLLVNEIKSMLDNSMFSSDMVNFHEINEFRAESVSELIDRLLREGWFEVRDLQRIIADNGIAHLPKFLINLRELAVGADECNLSAEELADLKSNVGVVDIELLISSLKERLDTESKTS